jgi:hypothetical protein
VVPAAIGTTLTLAGVKLAKDSLPTQKIRSFPVSKKLSGSNLREFRNYVSQLKKQDVLPKSVKTGSARPYFKIGGRTLGDFVNKNHKRLTPYFPPETRKLAPLGKPISFREIGLKGKTLADVLKELDEHGDDYEAIKRPGEKWAFQVETGNQSIKSYHAYSSLERFAQTLLDSEGIQQVLSKRSKSQELFKNLYLVRWNKTSKEWKPKPQKLIKKKRRR